MSQQVNVYRTLNLYDKANIVVSATTTRTETAGAILKAGTSSATITSATADTKFIQLYCTSSATSGDNRGIYNRLYMTGVGGGGESLRSYTDVSVACGTAHGAHISLGFGESTTVGSITGLGVAVRGTLGIPSGAMPSGGTYAAIQPEIYCFGASATVAAVTELSFIRCSNAGNATGVGLVDDKAYLLVLDGGAIASGNIVESSATEANYAYSIRVKLAGTVMYLMAASAVG